MLALAAVLAGPIAAAQNDESNAPETPLTTDNAGPDTAAVSPWVQYVEDHLPKVLVTRAFLTLKVWQWIGLALVILLGMALDLLVRALLSALANRLNTPVLAPRSHTVRGATSATNSCTAWRFCSKAVSL